MTDRIPTADELAAWRTLADAATEGPWEADIDGEAVAVAADLRGICEWYVEYENHAANMHFIAASRTAVPRLLDAVDQLTADQDALGEALGWALLHLRTASDADEEEPENMQKAMDAFSAWFNARRVLLGGAS